MKMKPKIRVSSSGDGWVIAWVDEHMLGYYVDRDLAYQAAYRAVVDGWAGQ